MLQWTDAFLFTLRVFDLLLIYPNRKFFFDTDIVAVDTQTFAIIFKAIANG